MLPSAYIDRMKTRILQPGSPVLTVQQPWTHFIFAGEKLVENRSWELRLRGPLFIHAGKSVSKADVRDCREVGLTVPDELPTGAILGSVVVVDCVPIGRLPRRLHGHIFALGPVCFILDDPQLLPDPVPAKGKLGIWRYDPDANPRHGNLF